MPERIAAQAEAGPNRPAVVEGDNVLSYADLRTRVNALARRITELGAGPDDVVALYLRRGTDLVVAASAALSAGAAYLALDTDTPSARSRDFIEGAGAKLVVTQAALAEQVAMAGATAVLVDALPEPAAGPAADGPTGWPVPALLPSSAAYVTYTSGSTGQPKAVVVEHGGLANLVGWYGEQYTVTTGDRMTQLARPSFDAFALEVWPCLTHGAALHIVPQNLLSVPAELVAWLHGRHISVAFVPTPLAVELIDLPWPREADGTARLRAMLVGGDRLGRGAPDGLPFMMYNNYGPTEGTVVATCGRVPAEREQRGTPPPIGTPIHGVTAYVLDPQGRPVAEGETGELHLGGAGVARGYLNAAPEETGRFGDDPFAGRSGARKYATGDLVRRDADDTLHFVGRIDDQLKINGVRIEPGEVEAVLLKQHGVLAAAVVPHRTAPDAAVALVAHAVLAEGVDPAEVRRGMTDELPAVMVPLAVVRVEALPLTAHGKVNRVELSARPLPEAQVKPEAPHGNALELQIAELWMELLGVPTVAPTDSFFDIGGDSLRVIRLVKAARREGLALQADDVYMYPVLRDLASAVLKAPQDDEQGR
ncbi:non-ribosomal peptide synthetase [Streptomyces sp. NPDC006530]|uniref:non-ribosomal peptide synthetase n=1 Tax=Streptomyces sp. NPDC006530 TaxID=3364750 RepID=UPI003678E487